MEILIILIEPLFPFQVTGNTVHMLLARIDSAGVTRGKRKKQTTPG